MTKKLSDLPPFTSMKEVMDDTEIPMEQKGCAFIDWVLHNVKGQCVQSTIHYSGEDIDDWAVPLSQFTQIRKDLLESIGVMEEP